jgi:hypothetical protein
MAAMRGKMGLDVGHLERRSHETEGKGTASMDELLRGVGTEKTDWNTVCGKMGRYLPIACGSDRREFFEYP